MLAGGSLTVVVVDDHVLVKKPHPASAIPTTAMMVATAARCMMVRFPVGFGGDPLGLQRSSRRRLVLAVGLYRLSHCAVSVKAPLAAVGMALILMFCLLLH